MGALNPPPLSEAFTAPKYNTIKIQFQSKNGIHWKTICIATIQLNCLNLVCFVVHKIEFYKIWKTKFIRRFLLFKITQRKRKSYCKLSKNICSNESVQRGIRHIYKNLWKNIDSGKSYLGERGMSYEEWARTSRIAHKLAELYKQGLAKFVYSLIV